MIPLGRYNISISQVDRWKEPSSCVHTVPIHTPCHLPSFLPSFVLSSIFFPHVSHIRYRQTKYQRIIPYSKLEKEKRRKDKHNKKKEIMWKNNSNTALFFKNKKTNPAFWEKKKKKEKRKNINPNYDTPMQIFSLPFF